MSEPARVWEPRVFQAGNPEPPSDVVLVEWIDIEEVGQYRFLGRVGKGWLWQETADEERESHGVRPNSWHGATVHCPGRYRVVES